MISTARKIIISIFCLSLLTSATIAGPPDKSESESIVISKGQQDSIAAQVRRQLQSAESLSLQLRRLDTLSLRMLDTLKKLPIDLSSLPESISFPEIIIDENGVIKVRTDSGLVVVSPESPLARGGYYSGESDNAPNQITRWGKSIIIDEGERVRSDIVVISGDVTVNGTVEGDVLAIGGNIYINSTGYIRGDATAVGGQVKKEEGAKVTGTSLSIGVPLFFIPRGSWIQVFLAILILVMIVSLFFAALSLSLFPKPIKRIATQLNAHPLKSFLFGYLVYIGSFLVWLLLLVSVIGIPLALLGQPVAMLIIVIFGYAAINMVLGQKIFREQSPIKAFLFGCLITTAIPFLLLLAGYFTNLLVMFVLNMILLAFLLFIVLPFGLGAALLARFGFGKRRQPGGAETGSPAIEVTQ